MMHGVYCKLTLYFDYKWRLGAAKST